MEQWRDVVGFESLYEVSDEGRIRRKGSVSMRALVPLPSGYLQVQLYKDNKYYSKYAHVLVLEAFVGLCPIGMETRHGDGNNQRNWLSNLSWGTSAQNSIDTLQHRNHKQVKLTEEQVRYIRDLPDRSPAQKSKTGEKTFQEEAKTLGISEVTFHNVRSRRTYRHIA